MIIEDSRQPGYQLHPPDSPEAEALLAERGLTRADLDRALAELARTEGIQIRTIVGINDDGVFGSRREGWRPDLPDACAEPFIPVLWLQVLELLGRVPEGSTARFRRGRHAAGLIGPQLSAILRRPTVGIASRPLHGMFGVRRRDGDGFYARCRQWLPRQIPPSRRPASTADWAPRLIAV